MNSMIALTDNQKAAYLKNSHLCPHCGSNDISGGFIEVDGDSAWQEVSCSTCEKEWRDVYKLTEVEDV